MIQVDSSAGQRVVLKLNDLRHQDEARLLFFICAGYKETNCFFLSSSHFVFLYNKFKFFSFKRRKKWSNILHFPNLILVDLIEDLLLNTAKNYFSKSVTVSVFSLLTHFLQPPHPSLHSNFLRNEWQSKICHERFVHLFANGK